MKGLVSTVDPETTEPVYHVPGEALAKIRKGMSASFARKLADLEIKIHKQMNLLAGDFVVVQTESRSIFSLIELLNELPEVEYAEPNYTNRSSKISSESVAQNPWDKFVVKEAAIEIIDSKIDLNSPRIKPEIRVNRKPIPPVRSEDYVEDITIKDLLFISDKVPVNLAEAVEAIDYATKKKVNVLSNTWVRDGFSRALDEAINAADKRGLSFVAAASIAANIGTSMAGAFNPTTFYDHKIKPSSHVSAGILSLYIAQEGNVEKTGRGRLIAKNVPTEEEIQTEWSSNSHNLTNSTLSLQNEFKITQNYSFPGAKFIKLEIEKLDSSTNIDLIILRNANGLIINNISGTGQNFETDYVETNLITVEFTSNATSTSVGSIIRNVKVIY